MKKNNLFSLLLLLSITNTTAQFRVDAMGGGQFISTNPIYWASALKTNVYTPYSVAYSLNYKSIDRFYVSALGWAMAIRGFWTASDSNLKTNIIPIDSALNKIRMLNGVEFTFKSDSTFDPDSSRKRFGFLAQDFEIILPDLVRTLPDSTKVLAYEDLIALAIEGIKEQQNQIDYLKLRIDSCCSSYTNQVPVLTTTIMSNISESSATSGGNITSDCGATITARGVCWSISQTPKISDNITTDGTGTGNFISIITGFSTNITYYVRAYATTSKGTGYGNVVSFSCCP